MKILYLGNFRESWRTEVYILKALESCGVEVVRVQEKGIEILPIIKKSNPDYFLYSKANNIRDFAKALDYCNNNNILSVCWLYDLYWGTPRELEAKEHNRFNADLVITTDGGHDDLWKKYGRNHIVLRQGVYSKESKLGKPNKDKYPEDIVFVGHNIKWFPNREKIMNFLEKTYGDRFAWRGKENEVRGQELNNLFASVKIVIGDSVFSSNYWSNRIYETLGRGGFLIHPRITGLDKEFSYYKHFIPYDAGNKKQLKEIIDYYLSHDKEREQIKLAGHKYCADNYTYKIRVKQLIKIIKNEKRRKRSLGSSYKECRNGTDKNKHRREISSKKKIRGESRSNGKSIRDNPSKRKGDKKEIRFLQGYPRVTAILLNYKRPENYPELVERLKNQEDVDLDIWVWDSGDLPSIEGVKIFKDPINPGLFIRWELARFVKTEYILFIDDDVIPLDNRVLIDTIKAQQKYTIDTVVGWKGVRIKGGHNESQHVHSKHVKEDFGVHFCKGNYMLFNKQNIANLKYMSPELLKIDSIAHGEFWYELQMGKCEPVHKVIKCLEGRLDNTKTRGIGLEYRKDHYIKQAKHLKKCLEILKN